MDICNIGVQYEKDKGYCKAVFSTPGASAIINVKNTNQDCTTNAEDPTSKVNVQTLRTTTVLNSKTKHTQQNYKENNYTNKFCDNKNNSKMFPTGTPIIPAVSRN